MTEKEFDMNELFLQQAILLDSNGRLKEIVEYIQKNDHFNVFLLNVLSYNINKSIENRIESNKYDLELMISRLFTSLKSKKDIDLFNQICPQDKKYLIENSLKNNISDSEKINEEMNKIKNI